MKKAFSMLLVIIALSISCNDAIKNSEARVVVELGTDVSDKTPKNELIGYYVGFFQDAKISDEDYKEIEESGNETIGYYVNTQNKINLSIDEISGKTVKGHSIVAGNNRPFSGSLVFKNGKYECTLKEPGNNKYDGTFTCTLSKDHISGTWQAYNLGIETPKRKYSLKRMAFKYNPSVMLNDQTDYVNWEKTVEVNDTIDSHEIAGTEEIEYEIQTMEAYATVSKKVYSLNASTLALTVSDVENLGKTDLIILRNTIYARHGYSFKDESLRHFFDAQEWYMPMYADIRDVITSLEKENIELLLRYEKNAGEYAYTFGR